MRKPNKNKMAGVNSLFAGVLQSEILKIHEDAVPENTKKATKFGMKVFRGKRRLKTESATRWSNKWTKTLFQDYLHCIANFCQALLLSS